jgi:hypothetical protein
MLKFTYTENGFRLEHLEHSLEDWLTTRVIVSLRAASSIHIEPTSASFLLPKDLPNLDKLQKLVGEEKSQVIALSPCDNEYLEIALTGTWVVSEPDSEEGIFVTAISQTLESFIHQLWLEAQNLASVTRD